MFVYCKIALFGIKEKRRWSRMRTRELILNNVIVTSPCKQDEILDVSEKIKEYLIKNNLFPIGPIIYFYDGDETYKVAVQVDRSIKMEESDVLAYAI